MKKIFFVIITIILLSGATYLTDKLFLKTYSDPKISSKNKITKKSSVKNDNSQTTTPQKSLPDTSSDVVLVNKTHKLSKNYIPSDLRTVKVKFASYAASNVRKMRANAANAAEGLFSAAKTDGITLLGVSCYRPYSYQEEVYTAKVKKDGKTEADKYVAEPGSSEHQSGLAMDLLSTEYTDLDDGFAKTKAYEWLKQNCAKYGFIIRYPKEKISITKYDFEPWHIRYVGTAAAQDIMQKGLTLEEYLGITD
ncbi:M15 family metallopeptidase [Clostridium guangxiense]|uniref:M15 family metallopeptidase n=2 Tax=Clostridium TaxID=1485 RepID=UPI001E6488AF|nr:M15 family metallopeptidase [Clostridium guangxiense]MCD2348012.1 M15 family metallopeptidase [Clostridium guangxiense]